jgi:acetyl esterase/lipase
MLFVQDANNDYYNEDIVSAERVNFNREGVTVIDGEIYSVTEDGILRMDCFYDQQIKEKKPAIIWIHGGGFTEEDISRKCRPERRFLHLVKEGYFLASIDYRLAQVRPFPAQMEECKCAVRYLRKNADKFGIDPERIGIWGESCGGQIAGLMSVSEGIPDFEDKGGCEGVSSEIQAAVSWYGALDALEFHNIRMAVDPDYPPRFAVIYGGSPEKMKDVLNKTNPMTYINKKHCPLLAMSSDTDDRISYTVNTEFCEQAEKYGNFAKYVVVKNQGHGYFEGEEYDQTLYDFFAEHLKNRVK